ncbi:hypothetical protein [Stieleria maiorica]|nr:hypothetical protein [Stieleria maiorica]
MTDLETTLRPKPQWTVRRLLLITTCTAIWIASLKAFPGFYAFALAICVMFSPSIVVAMFAILFSNDRKRTVAFQIPVPILAPLLSPRTMGTPSPPLTYWEDVFRGLMDMGMIGLLLSLIAVCLDFACRLIASWAIGASSVNR